MARLSMLLIVGLSFLGMPSAFRAQELTEPSRVEQEALRKTQSLLNAELLATKHLPKEMTLAAFVDAVTKEKQIVLRIDKEAFGEKYAEVAATPMFFPPYLAKTSLLFRLDWARAKSKIKFDYLIGANEITITTPPQALFTAAYDIRALVAKPSIVGLTDLAFRNADPTKRAALLMKKVLASFEDFSVPAIDGEAIQLLNGERLLVRTTGSRHAVFSLCMQTLAQLGDLAVVTTTSLYEIDDAAYTKLKNAKYVPIEELERRFLEGKTPKGQTLFDVLAKQKPILVSQDVKVDVGRMAMLLSRYDVSRCLPDPEQVIKSDKTRQIIQEGVAFSAVFTVRSDRRCIEAAFTEASQVPAIRQVKVSELQLRAANEGLGKEPPKDALAEVAVMKKAMHAQVLEIPDGGTILVPVHYRPRSLQQNNRWWVLAITSRIYMEEEERRIKAGQKK